MNNKSIKSKKMIFSLLILGVLFASVFIVKCSTTKPDDAMQPYFVAVSRDENLIAYSKDGSKWDYAKPFEEGTIGNELFSICYGTDENGDGIFVAVGKTNSSYVSFYSTDGVNWQEGENVHSSQWQKVCYGNGMFVAVSSNNKNVMYSSDGKKWEYVTVNMPGDGSGAKWENVCFGAGNFVILQSGGNRIAHSPNGKNWTVVLSALPNANWTSVCCGKDSDGKDMFVAVSGFSGGSGSKRIAYSPDGITWTSDEYLSVLGSWQNICYGQDKFVIVGGEWGTDPILFSKNCISWTKTKFDYSLKSICYGDRFVAISYVAVVYSTDGINWESGEPLRNSNWSSICFGYVNAKELQKRLF